MSVVVFVPGFGLINGDDLNSNFGLVLPIQRSVTLPQQVSIQTTDVILNINLSQSFTWNLPKASTRNGKPIVFVDAGLKFNAFPQTLQTFGTDVITNFGTTLFLGTNGQTLVLYPYNDGLNHGWFVQQTGGSGGGGGGTGTVTSVALSVPNGLSVSGSPIVTQGTLGLTWNGTIPNAQVPNFSSSLNGGVPASGGGTATFLRADGTWSSPVGSGTVTSVAATVPTGLAVSGSPITTNGTLGFTWSGTIPNAQVPNFSTGVNGGVPASGGGLLNFLRADGNWATLAGVIAGGISLSRNTSGQNFTFLLINATNDLPLTGATVVSFVSIDGGAQASTAGTTTEIGNGVYRYSPTQAETNGSACSFLFTATSAVPENVLFYTGGFQKNIAGQHVTFAMFTTAGVADASATVSVFVTKDGGSQVAGAGTVTNLGHGQYDYAPTQAETNGANISFTFSATGDVSQNITVFTSAGNVVSSVAMTVPTGLAVSGSPITSAGTFGLTWSGAIPAAQIPNFGTAINGGVPASGGGTTNFLRADGTWTAPAGGGGSPTFQTFQTFTSGSAATYTATSTNVAHIKVRMVGGGGGGGAQSTNAGSAGGTTSFCGWSAGAGGGGLGGNSNSTNGGSGGTPGSGQLIARISGASGSSGVGNSTGSTLASGAGGSSPFGGAGCGITNATGGAAAPNSGSGGGGGGGQGGTGAGSGGGAGEYVEFIMTKAQFTASTSYTVGAGGAGGAPGTVAGGAGAAGIILVEEFYF